MQKQELAGKVAVVTGAARGIGRDYALRLASLGASVVVVDRDLHAFSEYQGEHDLMTADTTADEIVESGRQALAFEADLTDASATQRVIDEVVERWGRIDICVCNAGGGTGAFNENTASTIDVDQLRVVLDRNLMTTVNTCVPVAAVMKRQTSGKIITVSSVSGLRPSRDGGYAHYATAKAAVIMYTRLLAQELGAYRVTANVIAPGMIMTGRLQPKFEEEGLDSLERDIPLGRVGRPRDCAGVIEFLATEQSDYVTGQVIVVDGGFTG
jgi:3-oxoacyl-[acyl-carrier protein] reductase